MLLNLFRRKPKVDDTITGLNDYLTAENFKIPNKKVQKVIALKQKIKEIETEIKRIEEQKTSEDERMFKSVAKRIGYLISIITNTQARFVYNPIGGAGFSLEINGVPKYRIYLSKSIGVGLHTWRYKLADDGFTPEYNRIEPIFIKINDSIFHDFSNYRSDEDIIRFLEQHCKPNASG